MKCLTRTEKDDRVIRAVVARRTKGSAFTLAHEAYRKEQEEVGAEVRADLAASRSEFVKKYELYLHGYQVL